MTRPFPQRQSDGVKLQIDDEGYFHLTYCTNIHPGDGWASVFANLRKFAPELKSQLAPARPFGIGLRLSAREARELLAEGRLASFRRYLDEQGLYVALLNGFPYGSFHEKPVKDSVYAPDWRDDARTEYTLDLVAILRALVPEGLDGGISTSPLSYKRWKLDDADRHWETITGNLVRVAEALVRGSQDDGRLLHLDIEPEPDCLLENSAEVIDFFERWLVPVGGELLAERLGVGTSDARSLLLNHIRVCFDCCHFAVEYEDPGEALRRFEESGIQIGRVQLSSAIEVVLPEDPRQAAEIMNHLRPFADPVYLHQVIERSGGKVKQFSDLDVALDSEEREADRQWRIHFHVPLFVAEYGGLGSTQAYVSQVLREVCKSRCTRHLEIETYTWAVLPDALKEELGNSIAREYNWVLGELSRLFETDA